MVVRVTKWSALAGSGLLALASTVAQAQTVQTVGVGNTLVTVNAASPTTALSSVAITGIAPGTTIGGIDYRPASPRTLYAISNVGQVYVINARTGVASVVGTPAVPTVSAIGFDFNPTVDRIRLVTQVGQDARINPDTGVLAATDGAIAYAATDANAGAIPTLAGVAYTNNVAGATTTTLYAIDTRSGLAAARLVTQGNLAGTVSPNTGQLFTVGSTTVVTGANVGFDISSTGTALATFTDPTTRVTSLYSVNLTTGAATLIGALPNGTTYEGLAIALASFQSMGATANQAVVGSRLDAFAGIPAGGLLTLLNGVDGLAGTPGAQSAALLALSPAAYSNLPELSLNAVEDAETNVLRYTRDLRGNAMGRGMGPGGSGTTLDDAGKVGAWLLGGARTGSYDAAVDRPRTEVGEYHVLGGLDYRFAPTIALGVFGGYSQTDARLTPGSPNSLLKSGFLGAYGTASVGSLYLDAWGSYTDLDWTLRRNIGFGGFNASLLGGTNGRVVAGGASTGLSFAFGGLEIEPFAAVRYADIRLDRFTESGGVAALVVGNMDRISVRSNVGARAGAKFDVGTATVRPQLRGSWYHEFRDQPRTIAAAFVDPRLSTTPFGFTTTPLSAEYFDVGGALNVAGSGPISMVADYDVKLDDERTVHALTIGMRYAF